MARLPWSGLTPTGWRWRPERPAAAEPTPPIEGLILSGGGARASFQLGALSYLYDEVGIAPTRFVGTSAGSIVCAVVAQHADPTRQRAALQQLSDIWTGMRDSSDMFTERSWFTRLQSHVPELRGLLTEPERSDRHRRTWKVPNWSRTGDRAAETAVSAESAERPLSVEPHPEDQLAWVDVDQPLTRAGWTPSMVVRMVNSLPSLRRAGRELPDIARGYEQERSMYRPGPVIRRLLDPEVFTHERVIASGNTVRVASVCLEDGDLYFFDERGVLRDRNDQPVPDTDPVPLETAVLASCTIPGFFTPVAAAGRHWIDGGARENLPAEMGLGLLGMDKAWAVVASPAGVPEETAWDQRDIIAVLLRAAAVISDESLRDEVAFARSAGATVIEPELDVHELAVVDPTLIQINFDYGWIRAAEAATGADPDQVRRHRELIAARIREHELVRASASVSMPEVAEEPLPDAEPAPQEAATDDDASELTQVRARIAELIDQCAPGELPPSAGEWS